MHTLSERNFHLVMGSVCAVAVLLENVLPRILSAWNPPQLGFLTFVAGLVWVARYTSWRAELHDEGDRTLAARVERLEQLQRGLEDDLRERFRRPL
ncbi:MAG: hypothetical protein ACO4CT_16305 [Planctomycetota bacterium]|jgi:hypothetical protein